jgi:two-component system, response regulator YesN
MYKIMIIDDEDDVRSAIATSIDWEREGYVLAGEAKNGREALECLPALMPDAVIADINMPYINGLELLKIIGEKFPQIKVIILTAFDDFEYAQSAVRSQAFDYILKPVTKQEFIEVLRHLKESMDREAADRENMGRLRQEYEASLPILRDKFLSALLTSYMETPDLEQKALRYGIDIQGKTIVIGVISVDEDQEGSWDGFGQEDGEELAKFAIFNIAGELMASHQAGKAFMHDRNIVLIGIAEDALDAVEDCMRVFDEIRYCISKYIAFTVTIGVGLPVKHLKEVHASYASAVEAGNYKILAGGDKVLYIGDIEPVDRKEARFGTEAEQKLNALIKTGSTGNVDAAVDGLFAKILACSVQEYDVYVIEMVLSIFKAADSAGVDTGCVFGGIDKIFKKILDMPNMGGACHEIKHICKKIISELAIMREDTSKKLIREAINYVSGHYMDPGVSIEALCRHLHVSQSYFCALFKKETGETFNNYLISCRIEAAKTFIRASNMKINEIAARVGYEDPNYFSFSFKKVCGISPREYQNCLEGSMQR